MTTPTHAQPQAGFFDFHGDTGQIRSRDHARLLLIDQTFMRDLVRLAMEQNDLSRIRQLGHHMGDRILRIFGATIRQGSYSEVIEHVHNLLSSFGWGTLSTRRVGQAFVASLQHAPQFDEDRLVIAALLGGIFSALSSQDVACVPVETSHDYLIVHPSVAETVWGWSKEPLNLNEMLRRLA